MCYLMHGDLGYQSDYEGTEGPRHRPDGENGPSVAKSTIVNSLHFADYTLRLDRFYFSSGEGEDTQRCVGLENKRKKNTNFTPKYFPWDLLFWGCEQ